MKLVFIIMLAILSLWSCERENITGRKAIGSSMSFGFSIQDGNNGTKSSVTVAEDVISNINIFVYDANGLLAASEYVGEYEDKVKINVYSGQDYTVYAIANVGDISQIAQARTEKGLNRLEWKIADLSTMVSDEGHMPFSGTLSSVSPDLKDQVIPMTRLFAKFRIILDTTALDSEVTLFDVRRVRLRNINRRVEYFGQSKAESADDIISVGMSYEGGEVVPAFSEGIDFYMPENAQGNLLSGNQEEETHQPSQEYMDLCTYVEFLVNYRSNTQYNDSLIYRYYLHDGLRMDNFDILRNEMYTCQTNFTGSGINETTWRIDVSGMKDYAESILVVPSSYVFNGIGETKTFNARVYPSSAADRRVRWVSGNQRIASVTDAGLVTAVGYGQCNIIAVAMDGSGVSQNARIMVRSVAEPKKVTLTPAEADIFIGESLALKAEVLPADASDKTVTWYSTDDDIAVVSSTGMVKGVSEGRCMVTATTNTGGYADTSIINVSAGNVKIENPGQVYVGVPVRLNLKEHVPSWATVVWSTSDSDVAEISEDGMLLAHKKGTVNVTAVSETGAADAVSVSIYAPNIVVRNQELYEGQNVKLSDIVKVSPDNGFELAYEVVVNPASVHVTGNETLYAAKRNTSSSLSTVKVCLADYPDIGTTFKVKVNPAIAAVLSGDDNRIVNTYGHISDGRSFDGFKTKISLDVTLAPDDYATWEVYKDGTRVYDISVDDDYTISAYAPAANGSYQIVGWNKTHSYNTGEITVEVYQYYDYEVGISNVSTYTISEGLQNLKYYALSLHARWSEDSWRRMGSQRQLFTGVEIVGAPNVSNKLFYGINGYGSSSILYMNRYKTFIRQTGSGTRKDIENFDPKSFLRGSFSNSSTAPVDGYTGQYYKLTAGSTGSSGLTGYYFIRQMNNVFYNIVDW